MASSSTFIGIWGQVIKLMQDASLRHPARSADAAACIKVELLVRRLMNMPAPPKAAWKKVVRDMKVPLQLGVAFCSAAQHSPSSPPVHASLKALSMLLRAAASAGLMKDGAAVGPLATSMRQQLQQAGVLPQLARLMAALAADLRAEAAALGSKSSEELCQLASTSLRKEHSQQTLQVVSPPLMYLQALWGCSTQTAADNSIAWLTDASGLAEAAMQLCTATLQHMSSVLQHVLPAVQQRAPQLTQELLRAQAAAAGAVMGLATNTTATLSEIQQHWPRQGSQAGREARARQQLRQLLLSPHCLPCIASMLALSALFAKHDCSLLQSAGGDQGQTGSSSRGMSSATGSSSGTSEQTHTPCQLKLLELLGLGPQLAAAAAVEWPTNRDAASLSMMVTLQLPNILTACTCCSDEVQAACSTPGQQEGDAEQQQRWQLEQQLWLLLPSVLVQCANNQLLLAAASDDAKEQQHMQLNASDLIKLSQEAIMTGVHLSQVPPAGDRSAAWGLPHPGWMDEVLGGVLQLAEKLRLQEQQWQQPAAAPPAAATGSSTTQHAAAQGSRLDAAVPTWIGKLGGRRLYVSDEGLEAHSLAQFECTGEMVDLLGALVAHSVFSFTRDPASCTTTNNAATPGLLDSSSSGGSSRDTGDSAAARAAASKAAAGETAPSMSQAAVANRLVEVCSALEAGLRCITAAAQAGPIGNISPPLTAYNCLQWLFLGSNCGAPSSSPALMWHLGLAGPEALPAELWQLYSLLSTVHKLGLCQSGSGADAPGELCWGQEAADACCWAAGHTAVTLLHPVELEAESMSAQAATSLFQAAAAALMQQPECSFLPSLVIFGRCCLVWAGQLQQQAPQLLLLLASGTAGGQQGQQPPQQQGDVQALHSAAWVCIPGAQQPAPEEEAAAGASSTGTPPPCWLEETVATVSAWVGGVTTPAAQAALAAARGGDSPQRLLQQLDALATAQQAVRQRLTDASLSSLVQQLQATGVMLSSIAVPHFCNNAGCVNISGPTEVGLVSGAAACVRGAAQPATAAAPVSARPGPSTSACARH